FNLPAVIIIFIVTTLLVIGIKESANFNNIIVVVKVAVVLLFITTKILLKLADSLIPITSSVVTMKIMNNIIVVVKVAVVLLFIVGAVRAINPANWHPFIPANTGPGHFGWSGIMTGAGIVFFAYIGFDAVSTAAQEAKNPQRDMPIGIIGSLLICTVLYILVSAIATGVVPYTQLDVPDPIAVAADQAEIGRAHV